MTAEELINKTDKVSGKYANFGMVVSEALKYAYVLAGMLLLVMLIMGGLNVMMAAGNPDKAKEGYGRITGALIGFLIVFLSYMVMQIVQVVLGVKIL